MNQKQKNLTVALQNLVQLIDAIMILYDECGLVCEYSKELERIQIFALNSQKNIELL